MARSLSLEGVFLSLTICRRPWIAARLLRHFVVQVYRASLLKEPAIGLSKVHSQRINILFCYRITKMREMDLGRSRRMNFRVADIQACYELWKSRGAEFITPPIPKYGEIRCYIRDPDGYIIEVGQSTTLKYG
jgi:Glyoxalase/Bleomycin resistance protein/Dioxygenase superfamily